jgi:hypothetical protein
LSAAIDLRFLADQGFWTALGSVATAAAVVVALTALFLERRARRHEERVAQARKISAWVERVDFSGPGTAVALNFSDGPVYRFVAFLVLAQGAGPHTGEEVAVRDDDLAHPGARLVLPPGQTRSSTRSGRCLRPRRRAVHASSRAWLAIWGDDAGGQARVPEGG